MPKDHTSATNKGRPAARPSDQNINDLRDKIIVNDETLEGIKEGDNAVIATEEEIITSGGPLPPADEDTGDEDTSNENANGENTDNENISDENPTDDNVNHENTDSEETEGNVDSEAHNEDTETDDSSANENPTENNKTNTDDILLAEEPIIIPEETPAEDNENAETEAPAEKTIAHEAENQAKNEPSKTETPEAEPEPATPAPVVAAEPTAAPAAAITKPAELAKKPKNKGLIALLIIFILAVIAGLATWLILRSTPEAQVTDAMTGLLTAKQVSSTGSINIKYNEEANPGIRSVKLDLGVTSNHIPASTTATLSITTANNTTFKLDIGETIDVDGTLYLKISGLQKAIESEKVPPAVQSYLSYFADVIKKTDNQWWMITIPDLISQLEDTLQTKIDTAYQDAYQCIVAKVASDDGSELANLYKKYPFIDVETYSGSNIEPVDGGTIFSISVNRARLDSFKSELPSTKYQSDLKNCLAKLPATTVNIDDDDDDEPISDLSENADEALDALSELPPAYVEVAGFDHHLVRFYYDYNVADYGTLNIDLRFSFPSEVSVDIPTNSRSITELIDMVIDDMEDMMYDISSGQSPFFIEVDCSSADDVETCLSDAYFD